MKKELEIVKSNFERIIMRLEHSVAVLDCDDFLKGDEESLLNEIIISSKEIGSLGNQISLKATGLFCVMGGMVERRKIV